MDQDRNSRIAKTFWYHPSSRDFYLIPDDVELPPGELELRTFGAEVRRVDAEAVEQWTTNLDGASAYLAAKLREGVMKVGEELGAAWRQGLAGATESVASAEQPRKEVCPDEGSRQPATPGSAAESLLQGAEHAEVIARIVEGTSAAIAAALRAHADRLREANRGATDERQVSGREGQDSDGDHSIES